MIVFFKINIHYLLRIFIHTYLKISILRAFRKFPCSQNYFFFKKDFIYLFLEWGRERGRETSMSKWNINCLPLSCTLTNQGLVPQPTHTHWVGIEPATFHFLGWHSTYWAILLRANKTLSLLNNDSLITKKWRHNHFIEKFTILFPVNIFGTYMFVLY